MKADGRIVFLENTQLAAQTSMPIDGNMAVTLTPQLTTWGAVGCIWVSALNPQFTPFIFGDVGRLKMTLPRFLRS